jgi:hypothetical protein
LGFAGTFFVAGSFRWINLNGRSDIQSRVQKLAVCTISVEGVEKKKCIEEKRTRQPVLTAERNVKFRSSQTVPGQFTAASATQNEDHRADIKPSS